MCLYCLIQNICQFVLYVLYPYRYTRTIKTNDNERLYLCCTFAKWILMCSCFTVEWTKLLNIIGGPQGAGGVQVPPTQKILLTSLGKDVPTPPPKCFYWIHNDLESLFEKTKQIRKFQNISSKFVENFLEDHLK